MSNTDFDIKAIEKEFKDILRKDLDKGSLTTWIKPLKIILIKENIVTFQVMSKFHYEFLKRQYNKQIVDALKNILGVDTIITEFLIDSTTEFSLDTLHSDDQMDSKLKYPTPEETNNNKNSSIEESTKKSTVNLAKKYKETQLNPKFTFDNFVQGNGNETAYASAMSVAKNLKDSIYNPLLLFGGVGLGKTHLVQAIGNAVFNDGVSENILYLPSDQFVQELVDSIQKKTIDKFKKYLKTKDLIIIDDIQFFAGKGKSQEELFHIYNYIYNNNGQIILTSDFHPNEIHKLEDRLKSRFSQGLSTDIRPPDLETRAAIINLKAEELNFKIKPDVVLFIANSINTNVRDLEGAVKTLYFHQSLKAGEIEIPKAKEILKGINTAKKSTLNIDKIQDIVSEYFSIPKDLLLTKTRTKEVADARAIAMYLCTTQLTATTKSIGAHFGNREHSTVSHASNKILTKLNQKDSKVTNIIEEILNVINLSTY